MTKETKRNELFRAPRSAKGYLFAVGSCFITKECCKMWPSSTKQLRLVSVNGSPKYDARGKCGRRRTMTTPGKMQNKFFVFVPGLYAFHLPRLLSPMLKLETSEGDNNLAECGVYIVDHLMIVPVVVALCLVFFNLKKQPLCPHVWGGCSTAAAAVDDDDGGDDDSVAKMQSIFDWIFSPLMLRTIGFGSLFVWPLFLSPSSL